MKRLLTVALLIILCTSFSVAQWTMITQIDTAASRYKSVDCVGSAVWIVGGSSPFTGNYGYRSTDNGTTWTQFNLPLTTGTSTGVSNISALDANTAIVGLNTGQIIRTTNGGVKWDTVFSYSVGLGGWMDGVMFINSTIAVAFGDAEDNGLMIARSTDAGASWTRLTGLPGTLPTPNAWASYYTYGQAMDVFGNTIWLSLYDGSGINPHIAKSTDAGVTWTDMEIVLPGGAAYNYRFHAIAFKDDSIGYGICRGLSSSMAEYVVKTTNGGTTWSDTIAVDNVWPHNLADPSNVKPIRGTNTVIALGGSGASPYKPRAWRSTDAGATWTRFVPSGWRGFLMNADFTSATSGYAVGTYFAYKYDGTTGVEYPVTLPEGYALAQNYPNPFNPATTIVYSIGRAGMVDLKVYDLLGRVVATLMNEQQSAGTHSVMFDAAGLPSGVYFYSVQSGTFRATKSLVVLK